MRVIYLGTPENSAHCLEYLLDEGIQIVGVVTQPDRPFGRNLAIKEPPVKKIALARGIPVFQPEKASGRDSIDKLTMLAPDIIAVFAFGEFLSDDFLRIPKISTVNLHLSLLPKYRGAAPVQWAIINGEKITGVTSFHIVKEIDAGDIIYQEEAPIFDNDNAATLMDRLTTIGSKLFAKTLKDLFSGIAPRIPQQHSLAIRAPKLKKSDGHIDWSLDAQHIRNLIRGMNPWPCAYSFWNTPKSQKIVRFLFASLMESGIGEPGKVFVSGNDFCVYTGDKALKITSVQIEGRRAMSGQEFLNGHREIVGAILK